MEKPGITQLAALADDLRARHFTDTPLVLANVWDAASARAVAQAGHSALATSSSAVAASLGLGDHEQMTADTVFAAVERIAAAVDIPVTADLEAGYRLPADELADRLLLAGAVGCNLEDGDHHGPGPLLDMERQAGYIADVCAAGRRAGVNVVVNARVDVYIRRAVAPEDLLAETLRRGRAYLEAGAACVYPIGVTDESIIAALVEGMGGPVNVWLRPNSPTLERMRTLGVARVSLASALQHQVSDTMTRLAADLLRGDDAWIRRPAQN